MVTSVPDSNVYVLSYNNFNKVESSKLDLVNRSGTSNEILREVLGVETTMPLWAENKLSQIIGQYSGQPLTERSLRGIKKALSDIGLDDLFPEALDKVMGQKPND